MKPLSILIVDDDQIERLKFKQVCKKLNLLDAVVEAKNGLEALHILNDKKNSFDLIISDLYMPKINGLQFLKSLKKLPQYNTIPVVIMTTSTSKKDFVNCTLEGVSAYHNKPHKFSEYFLKVSTILESCRKIELTY